MIFILRWYGFLIWQLTNGPQLSMVYTLIEHRNEVLKCTKLKHQLTFKNFSPYVKIWFFFVHVEGWSYFYEKPKTEQPALCGILRRFHSLHSHRPQHARIRSVIVKNFMVTVLTQARFPFKNGSRTTIEILN